MHNRPWQDQDDDRLIEQIQRRDAGWRDMLAELIGRHHGALVARCRAYLRIREDAEDAAQEAELRAFNAIHAFRGDSAFRTWLFTIGDRQCHSLASRRMRHVMDEHLSAVIGLHEEMRHRSAPSWELKGLLLDSLHKMPETARDVLMLRYYKELSLDEMAQVMGLGLSATKMRLYRALQQLADELPDEALAA